MGEMQENTKWIMKWADRMYATSKNKKMKGEKMAKDLNKKICPLMAAGWFASSGAVDQTPYCDEDRCAWYLGQSQNSGIVFGCAITEIAWCKIDEIR